MDFSFSEEQTLLRNTIQSFIQDNYDFDKRQAIVKSEEGMKQENWKQFAELGLLGLPFSEEDGGLNFGSVETMIVAEEFGKGLVVEPYIQTVVTCGGFLRRVSAPDSYIRAASITKILWLPLFKILSNCLSIS